MKKSHTEIFGNHTTKGVTAGQNTAKKEGKNGKPSAIYVVKTNQLF